MDEYQKAPRSAPVFCLRRRFDSASPAGYMRFWTPDRKRATSVVTKPPTIFAQLARRSVPVKQPPHRIPFPYAEPFAGLRRPWTTWRNRISSRGRKIDMSDEAFASGSLGLLPKEPGRVFGHHTEKAKTLRACTTTPAACTGHRRPVRSAPQGRVLRVRHQRQRHQDCTNQRTWPTGQAIGATEGYALHNRDSWGNKWFWAPESFSAMAGSICITAWSASPSRLPSLRWAHSNGRWSHHLDVGEIDTHPFVDDDGKVYMYWVKFDRGNVIYVAEMMTTCWA